MTTHESAWAAYRARSCDGKKRLTHAAACALVLRLRAQGERRDAYRCHHCRGYHLAHPPTMHVLTEIAQLLRAHSGNAPTTKGT